MAGDAAADAELYRHLFESAGDGVYVIDSGSGRIVDANATACRRLGYGREELLGLPVAAIDAAAEGTAGWRPLDERAGGGPFSVEHRREDGSTYRAEVNAARVETGGGEYVVGIARATESGGGGGARELFRKVFEHSNDAIVIFDPGADAILEANAGAVDLLGYERAELLSLGPSDVHPEEYEQFRAFVERVTDRGNGWTDRLSCLTSSGERVPAEISASTIRFEGRRCVLAMIRDVSDLRAYEERLERQNERLERFATIVSHDLRNPLSVATGELELAAADCGSDHVEAARTALERMDEMIGDLLTLARESGSVDRTEPVSIPSLVEGCWHNVDTGGADVAVRTDATVLADRKRLSHVLENLFRNSVEHAGPEVTVEIGDLDGGFYVADDGPGIPADEREQVFELGYTGAEDGSGFGLSIVAEIVEAHGWEIDATDSEEGGARFEITGVERVE